MKKFETTMGPITLNTPGGIHKQNIKTYDSKRYEKSRKKNVLSQISIIMLQTYVSLPFPTIILLL